MPRWPLRGRLSPRVHLRWPSITSARSRRDRRGSAVTPPAFAPVSSRLVLEDRVELPRLVPGVARAANVRARRRRGRPGGRPDRQRQDVASLQDARLRPPSWRPKLRPSSSRASWPVSSRSSRPPRQDTRSMNSRAVIVDEIARLADEGPTADELVAREGTGRGTVRLPAPDRGRVRRQVRSAQRLQHLRRRSSVFRARSRALPGL